MATITFKMKIAPEETIVIAPAFKHSHCNMQEFRNHSKYGAYAKSNLFLSLLARVRRDLFGSCGIIRLDNLPKNVTIDRSGFLAVVTIKL